MRMSSPRMHHQLSLWNSSPHPPPRSPIKDARVPSRCDTPIRFGDAALPSPVNLFSGKAYYAEHDVEVEGDEVASAGLWRKVESLQTALRRERLRELERERERETEHGLELAIIDRLHAKCQALEEKEAGMEQDRNKRLMQFQAVSGWLPPFSPRGRVLETEGERGREREREEVWPNTPTGREGLEVKQTEEELHWRVLEKETEEALEDLRADFERERQEQKEREMEKEWERLGEKRQGGGMGNSLQERESREERELAKETDELRAKFEREKERKREWEREEKNELRGRGRGKMLSHTRQLPHPNSEQVFALLLPAYIKGSYT
jgi:hypothetical protein